MEINDNIAGLGKNHDKEAEENDLPKKQSGAQPAAENLDMEPNSVNTQGNAEFGSSEEKGQTDEPTQPIGDVHTEAEEYAKQEHDKADSWENTNETGPDRPQF